MTPERLDEIKIFIGDYGCHMERFPVGLCMELLGYIDELNSTIRIMEHTRKMKEKADAIVYERRCAKLDLIHDSMKEILSRIQPYRHN